MQIADSAVGISASHTHAIGKVSGGVKQNEVDTTCNGGRPTDTPQHTNATTPGPSASYSTAA